MTALSWPAAAKAAKGRLRPSREGEEGGNLTDAGHERETALMH
jgi:hypothetical protein